MGTGRGWLRWSVAAGGVLVVLLVLGLVVLSTNVGTPSSRYDEATLPHACELVHEPTVRALAGEVSLTRGVESGSDGGGFGLTPDTAVSTCSSATGSASNGTVHATAYVFSSAQFHLGRSGEEQASRMLATQQEAKRSAYPDGCAYERDDPAEVCGMYDDRGAILYVQHENVFVEIRFHSFRESLRGTDPAGREQPPDMTRMMTSLADEITARLGEVREG